MISWQPIEIRTYHYHAKLKTLNDKVSQVEQHENHREKASVKNITTLTFQNFISLGQTEPGSTVANKDLLTKFNLIE